MLGREMNEADQVLILDLVTALHRSKNKRKNRHVKLEFSFLEEMYS